jgi:hypothetical protein
MGRILARVLGRLLVRVPGRTVPAASALPAAPRRRRRRLRGRGVGGPADIGIAVANVHYRQGIPEVKYAGNDADAMAKAMPRVFGIGDLRLRCSLR